MKTETISLKKLIASDGMLITDADTQTMRAKTIYLGNDDNPDNYVEIPEDTPLPNIEETETETENIESEE